jgi:hypothetical protein
MHGSRSVRSAGKFLFSVVTGRTSRILVRPDERLSAGRTMMFAYDRLTRGVTADPTSPARGERLNGEARRLRQPRPALRALAPQIAITMIFFYWPAAQAVRQSFLVEDAFGLSTSSSGSRTTPTCSPTRAITDAVDDGRVLHGRTVTSLIRRIAPRRDGDRELKAGRATVPCSSGPTLSRRRSRACSGSSCSTRRLGILAQGLRSLGLDWNPRLNGNHA